MLGAGQSCPKYRYTGIKSSTGLNPFSIYISLEEASSIMLDYTYHFVCVYGLWICYEYELTKAKPKMYIYVYVSNK